MGNIREGGNLSANIGAGTDSVWLQDADLCEKMASNTSHHILGEKGFPSMPQFINRELVYVGWGLSATSVFASLTRLVFHLSLLLMSCHQSQPNRF